MSPLKRIAWLCLNWRRQFKISIAAPIEVAYGGEEDRLFEAVPANVNDLHDAQRVLFGPLILAHAIRQINGTCRYNQLRLASKAECREALSASGILEKIKDKGYELGMLNGYFVFLRDAQPLYFHFFERYGYRFTLLLNLKTCEGAVQVMQRLEEFESGASGISNILQRVSA